MFTGSDLIRKRKGKRRKGENKERKNERQRHRKFRILCIPIDFPLSDACSISVPRKEVL